MLHRAKKNPGTFMIRLRVINGIVTSEQVSDWGVRVRVRVRASSRQVSSSSSSSSSSNS